MSGKETSKSRKYDLVAPDGGWGYMIWIAVTINMITTSAFMSCIGMMYNEIYIQLNMDSTSINLLNGISSISVSIAGFITGPLLGCLSIRKLGIVSAVFLNLGTFAITFVNSKALFFLSSGVVQSFGSGVLINLTYTILNQYFVTKRMLSVALTQTITVFVSLFTPQFVKWSSDEYGHRGTLILITGIYMQAFVAVTIMQPVKWHLKKIEIEISEDRDKELNPLLKHDEANKESSNTPEEKSPNTESLILVTAEKSILSDNDVKENEKQNSMFREIFRDFLDVPFLKSYLLSNSSIGLAIITFCDVIFILMLPQALYFMNWTEGDVAWAVSLSSFGDVVMKIVFILFNKVLLKFGTSEIYIIGLLLAFFARLGMLWSENPTVMLIFIVFIGMTRSVLLLLPTLVIAESVVKEKFTSALGIYMFMSGAIFLIFGPVIGAIRDLTNSYGTAFYIITSCYAIVCLFWLIELLYKKNKDKRLKKIKKIPESA